MGEFLATVSFLLAAAQANVAVAAFIFWLIFTRREAATSAGLDLGAEDDIDNDYADADEALGLESHASSSRDAASDALRFRVGAVTLGVHLFVALLIITAAARANLHIFGYFSVFVGLLTSTYEAAVWSFDIPGLSCHGAIAARARHRSPYRTVSANVTALVNSAPLALMCALLTMHSFLGTMLVFCFVSFFAFNQVRYWWVPYFFNTMPHPDVVRYLAGASPLVPLLPPISDHAVRPDFEHAILGVLTAVLCYCVWGQTMVTLVVGDPGDHPAPLGSTAAHLQAPVAASGGSPYWVM
eukprot:TRINITY_DN57507_c0_g1_i1.p1 TRINITY_DN57507_c0_g1~~TRINITY_DN57507_c0_g1_i1.p1  ORF type:complete len:298 (-),score=32.52 TRINITY_DN57507_c0_g1_i1:340-1233(-)